MKVNRSAAGFESGHKERRISAYCEIATRKLRFSRLQQRDLRLAALSVPEHPLVVALCREFGGIPGEPAPRDLLSDELQRHLDDACELDAEIEFAPFCDLPLNECLADPEQMHRPGARRMLALLRECDRTALLKRVPDLPVFPAVARQVIEATRNPESHFEALLHLAHSEQVLAGALISEANTATRPNMMRINSVKDAVLRIGSIQTARTMMAAAVKPLLVEISGFQDLWQHTTEVARCTEAVAAITNIVPPADAYTLGLLHDIGRLLIQFAPKTALDSRQSLVNNGCVPSVAEWLTMGMSHSEAGAEVLRHWQFPEDYVDAVRFHHEPEHSSGNLASLLYLIEFWTASEEDLPSTARLQAALSKVGLDPTTLRITLDGTCGTPGNARDRAYHMQMN